MTSLDIMVSIANLAIRRGAAPVNKYVGCWELQVDPRWWLAVNGHPTPTLCSKGGEPVLPFHAYIEFNGWPWGIVGPGGGITGDGAVANVTAFLIALEAA